MRIIEMARGLRELGLLALVALPNVPAAAQDTFLFLQGQLGQPSLMVRHEIGTTTFEPVATIDRRIASLATDHQGRLLAATDDEPFVSILTIDPATGAVLDEIVTEVETVNPIASTFFSATVIDLLVRFDGDLVVSVWWTGLVNAQLTRVSVVDPATGAVIEQASFEQCYLGELGEDADGLVALAGQDTLYHLDLDDPNAILYDYETVDGLAGAPNAGAAADAEGRLIVLRSFPRTGFSSSRSIR